MAQCPRHPGSVATDLCVECGECVCGQCAWVTPDRRVFCPNCKGAGMSRTPPPVEPETDSEHFFDTAPVAKPRKQPPVRLEWSEPGPKTVAPAGTKNSKAAIASIILPFVCWCYGAPVGLILAIRERKLIKEGRSTSSTGLVTASIWINAVMVAGSILMFILARK